MRSDIGWYKRVLDALKGHLKTGVPYTHTSTPLCQRQNRLAEQNLRILMKGLGRLVILGRPNPELSTEFCNWLYPPRTVLWGASCMVLEYPFHWGLQEPRRGLAGT